MIELTQELLQELLHYDPETGVWTWNSPLPRSRVKPGDVAGRITQDGRRQIRIASGFYYAARLAFLYMTGKWPNNQVDHINRMRSDDRWCNLRQANQSQNSYNRSWCESKGDMRGISECGHQYALSIGGTYLGLFHELDEAKRYRDDYLKAIAGPFANPLGAIS